MAKKTEDEVLNAGQTEDTKGTAAGETAAAEGSDTDADAEVTEEGGGEEAADDAGKLLIARKPILYLARQYKVGEIIPANDAAMVEAWLDAGSAVWMAVPEKVPKAKPVTAEPGLGGIAAAAAESDSDDLVGRVPKTKSRKK